MSHHGVNLLPGLLPLERPLRPDKKRRLKKTRSGEVSYSQDIDDIASIDDEMFVLAPGEDSEPMEAADAEVEIRTSAASLFSFAAMKTLLQAQEEK